VKGNLSKEQIERMLQDAEQFSEADKLVKERLDSLHQLENYLHSVRNQIDDKQKLKDKLPDTDKTTITDALKETQDWLSSNLDADKNALEERMEDLQKIISPLIAKVYQQSTGQQADEEFDDI